MTNQSVVLPGKVRIEYYGPRVGAVTYFGKRRKYRFGNNAIDRFADVDPEDVDMLLRTQGFRVAKLDHEAEIPGIGPDFIPAPDNEPEQVIEPEPVEELELPETFNPPMPSTVKEIQEEVKDADIDTLLAWLNEEQSGKARKTALEAINAALEEQFA